MYLQYLNPLRWKKSFLAAILVVFLAVWFLFLDTYSIYTRYELNQRKTELKEKTEELRKKTEEIEQKLTEIESNPELLEQIAREEYGMKKPGETVYKIEEE